MIIILVLCAIVIGLFLLSMKDDDMLVVSFGVGFFFIATTTIIIIGTSYSTYLDTRAFWDVTNEQYTEAIEIYADRAVLKINENTFTDFKYQGYQENIAEFIKDLRHKVVDYNKTIIEKRIMEKSLVFNWLIIAPDDDMRIIKMR